jgi:hypothetical protein
MISSTVASTASTKLHRHTPSIDRLKRYVLFLCSFLCLAHSAEAAVRRASSVCAMHAPSRSPSLLQKRPRCHSFWSHLQVRFLLAFFCSLFCFLSEFKYRLQINAKATAAALQPPS